MAPLMELSEADGGMDWSTPSAAAVEEVPRAAPQVLRKQASPTIQKTETSF